MSDQKLRVGIIGAGRRVVGNYLPALDMLSDYVSVEWVFARNYERLVDAVDPWKLTPLKRLDGEALAQIDILAVSVPTTQNAPALNQVLPFSSALDLVIDTPVIGSISEIRATHPLLSKFKSVTVTEDFMNFPDFEAVRQAVAAGAIGRVRHIILDGMGYFNHGLALIRSFGDFSPVVSSRRVKLGGDFSVVCFSLSSGVEGAVVYPYRRYAGAYGVVGENGSIVSSSDSLPFIRSNNIHLSEILRRDGVISAVKIEGPNYHCSTELPGMKRLVQLPNADKTDLNLMRSFGLAAVFRSLWETNINRRYGVNNALYDSFMSKIAMRVPFLWDPATLFGRNSVTLGLQLASRG